MRARSHNDDLLETVRGSHRYVAVVADPVNRFLDVLVSRSPPLSYKRHEYYGTCRPHLVAFYFVGIKDQESASFFYIPDNLTGCPSVFLWRSQYYTSPAHLNHPMQK